MMRYLFVGYGEPFVCSSGLDSACVVWDTSAARDDGSEDACGFVLWWDAHLHEHFSDDDIIVILEDRAEDDGDAILLRLQVPETRQKGQRESETGP